MLPPSLLLSSPTVMTTRPFSSLVKAAATATGSSSAPLTSKAFFSPPLHQQEQQLSSKSFTTINRKTPYNLCFLRHGQSTWNRDNRFIGWTDTPLTDDGVLEARLAGKMLRNSGILFDEVHTSMLRRCIRTTNLVLMEMEQEYIPVYKHFRLNERCVNGAL
jgi:Histidine phosphatase superfamily (branch 1)